jgi:hypothetical protein
MNEAIVIEGDQVVLVRPPVDHVEDVDFTEFDVAIIDLTLPRGFRRVRPGATGRSVRYRRHPHVGRSCAIRSRRTERACVLGKTISTGGPHPPPRRGARRNRRRLRTVWRRRGRVAVARTTVDRLIGTSSLGRRVARASPLEQDATPAVGSASFPRSAAGDPWRDTDAASSMSMTKSYGSRA